VHARLGIIAFEFGAAPPALRHMNALPHLPVWADIWPAGPPALRFWSLYECRQLWRTVMHGPVPAALILGMATPSIFIELLPQNTLAIL